LCFANAASLPAPAGLLHLYYTTLTFLFFRVFMRISYQVSYPFFLSRREV
jgi:hypothetical protein